MISQTGLTLTTGGEVPAGRRIQISRLFNVIFIHELSGC